MNILIECSNLSQKKSKTIQERVGMVIHWELCKKLKFDQTTKPESILENETHKTILDFEILTDHLISDRRIPYDN